MRLADPMIINMQNYYHGAITNNLGDVEATQWAIWAIIYHYTSSNENPRYGCCPVMHPIPGADKEEG